MENGSFSMVFVDIPDMPDFFRNVWEAFYGWIETLDNYPLSLEVVLGLVGLIILLFFSAVISGSEVALFSITQNKFDSLQEKKKRAARYISRLLTRPRQLLATVILANSFINIGFIIGGTVLAESVFDFSEFPAIGFGIEVVTIMLLLLLFGEFIPKVYASYFYEWVAGKTAYPITVMERILRPFSGILVNSSVFFREDISQKEGSISIDDLSQAFDIAGNPAKSDKEILQGIAKFGNIEAQEIMKPRVDVIALDVSYYYSNVISVIVNNSHSRLPVYKETFDNIQGILYIKDLLPYLDADKDMEWPYLLHEPYFVPGNKKIDDLLEEFQQMKIHMAVVVDEYGGTNGIVTLEDILEEIMGEISDESDAEEEVVYTKLDSNNYIFEGKTLLNDVYKILDIDEHTFDDIRGEAETLAGMILEMRGEIPQEKEKLKYKNFLFTVDEVNQRRIKNVRVTFE